MESIFLIGIGIIVGLFIVRGTFSGPRETQIVFVPVQSTEPSAEGLGCLPLIVIGVVILLVASIIG